MISQKPRVRISESRNCDSKATERLCATARRKLRYSDFFARQLLTTPTFPNHIIGVSPRIVWHEEVSHCSLIFVKKKRSYPIFFYSPMRPPVFLISLCFYERIWIACLFFYLGLPKHHWDTKVRPTPTLWNQAASRYPWNTESISHSPVDWSHEAHVCNSFSHHTHRHNVRRQAQRHCAKVRVPDTARPVGLWSAVRQAERGLLQRLSKLWQLSREARVPRHQRHNRPDLGRHGDRRLPPEAGGRGSVQRRLRRREDQMLPASHVRPRQRFRTQRSRARQVLH